MATFKYTAKRGLISGHSLGTGYTIETELTEHIPIDEVDSVQQFTTDSSETILTGFRTSHKFTTDYLTNAQMLEFREFLLSASSGEQVIFDVLGTISTPDVLVNGVLVVNKKVQPTRLGNQYYQFSFEIKEQ